MNADMTAYDNAMALVRDQIAALASYRETLARCQAENETLIQGLRFYAEADWRTVAMADRGEKAKTILKEVVG